MWLRITTEVGTESSVSEPTAKNLPGINLRDKNDQNQEGSRQHVLTASTLKLGGILGRGG